MIKIQHALPILKAVSLFSVALSATVLPRYNYMHYKQEWI